MIPLLSLFFISALVLVFLLLWLPWTFEVKVEIGRKSYLDYRLVALWGSVSLLPLLNRVSRAIADEIRALLPDEEARHPQDIVERIGSYTGILPSKFALHHLHALVCTGDLESRG